MTTLPNLYETDFFLWTQQQAQWIREQQFERLDAENVAEEIESIGKHLHQELNFRLYRVLMHLLLWRYHHQRTKEIRLPVMRWRHDMTKILRDSLSLRAYLEEELTEEYDFARDLAGIDCGLGKEVFPKECPWTLEQVLDEDFWPL
jgi:hypothetical protein